MLLLWRSKVNTLPAKVTADAADVLLPANHTWSTHTIDTSYVSLSLSLCLWNVCILISFKQKTFV